MSPEESNVLDLSGDKIRWPARDYPAAVRQAFQNPESFSHFKRTEFAKAYLDFRSLRQPQFVIPETREELERVLSFKKARFTHWIPNVWHWDDKKEWRRKILSRSRITDETRTIYRGAVNGVRLSLAESDGDLELAVQRADRTGDWDFYAYNAEGRLETRPLFRTTRYSRVAATAPYVCMACHYSPAQRTFQLAPANFLSVDSFPDDPFLEANVTAK